MTPTKLATRYRRLKTKETELKAQLDALRTEISDLIASGTPVADDAAELILRPTNLKTYSVDDMLALLANLPSGVTIDPSTVLRVQSSAIKTLPDNLASQVGYTVDTIHKLIIKTKPVARLR